MSYFLDFWVCWACWMLVEIFAIMSAITRNFRIVRGWRDFWENCPHVIVRWNYAGSRKSQIILRTPLAEALHHFRDTENCLGLHCTRNRPSLRMTRQFNRNCSPEWVQGSRKRNWRVDASVGCFFWRKRCVSFFSPWTLLRIRSSMINLVKEVKILRE